MNIRFAPNTLYYGDCLDIMSGFPDNYIDLICLDPPFNSNRNYNNIFRGSGLKTDAQIKAFDDTWEWNAQSAERVDRLKNAVANPASKVIAGFEGFIPQSKMLSYTSYMAERLFMMHGILKETGSIYLHCDPYASHYLKLIMDAIFGEKNFRNEIVWSYRSGGVSKNWFARKHDILLFYTKTSRNVHTFVICHLCGNECLVADVEADEHPDILSSYVCRRCAAAYSQYEIEMMRVEAYRGMPGCQTTISVRIADL